MKDDDIWTTEQLNELNAEITKDLEKMSNKPTPIQFYEYMLRLQHITDKETRHAYMDDYLCEVLKSLGYKRGIKIFEESDKWYA